MKELVILDGVAPSMSAEYTLVHSELLLSHVAYSEELYIHDKFVITACYTLYDMKALTNDN